MSVAIELGHARLCHAAAGLTCKVESSVVFSSPNPEHNAFLHLHTADQILSGAYWVTRGADLHVNFDIKYDSVLQGYMTQNAWREAIIALLRDARVRMTRAYLDSTNTHYRCSSGSSCALDHQRRLHHAMEAENSAGLLLV